MAKKATSVTVPVKGTVGLHYYRPWADSGSKPDIKSLVIWNSSSGKVGEYTIEGRTFQRGTATGGFWNLSLQDLKALRDGLNEFIAREESHG